MASSPPLYDLTLLLSKNGEDDQRAKIVTDVQNAIASAGGSVERHDEWGTRPLTYRIRHETEAEYHLLQFHGPTSLLESLSHSLRIDDGVLRFRVIKVIPGMPDAPDSPPPVVATATPAGSTTAAVAAPSGADES